jgi:Tfp pilus assembly protein PilF
LERDDIAQAYAAALCYRHLVFSDRKARANANLLLGKCYLRRGDWRSALVHLEDGLNDSPNSSLILEELAAAHMLGGNYSEARNTLEQVAERLLSAQAKAALAFARSKDKQAVE